MSVYSKAVPQGKPVGKARKCHSVVAHVRAQIALLVSLDLHEPSGPINFSYRESSYRWLALAAHRRMYIEELAPRVEELCSDVEERQRVGGK